MRKYLLILSTILCAATVSAQNTPVVTGSGTLPATEEAQEPEQQRFGYLSYEEALKSMPEYAQAQKSVAELKASYDAEMKRAEGEFTRKFNEFVDGQKSFPENILLKRQKELQQLMEQSMAFKEEARKMLAKAEAEIMAPLHLRLKEILGKIGNDRNYAYILNTDANAYPFINPENGDDITEAVKNRLK